MLCIFFETPFSKRGIIINHFTKSNHCLKGLGHAICYKYLFQGPLWLLTFLPKSLNVFRMNCIPKQIVQFCYFYYIARHWNCFLSSVAMNEIRIETWKAGQLFQVLMQCLLCKITKHFYGLCSLMKSVWCLLHISTGVFFVWVKTWTNDFSTELT